MGFGLGIFSGLVLASTSVADIPEPIVLLGWAGLSIGVIVAFIFGVRNSRRCNCSIWSSFGDGLRTLWSFVWAFMP